MGQFKWTWWRLAIGRRRGSGRFRKPPRHEVTMGATHAALWFRVIGTLYIHIKTRSHQGGYWNGIPDSW
jgi:hypothetical protein